MQPGSPPARTTQPTTAQQRTDSTEQGVVTVPVVLPTKNDDGEWLCIECATPATLQGALDCDGIDCPGGSGTDGPHTHPAMWCDTHAPV